MKQLWITLVRSYIKLGLFFYYKKITVIGKENIPTKGAVLFVSNHQNALIDPLIIGTTNGRSAHFLTRAGVFKRKLIIKFFNSIQLIPIYRLRDGWNTLAKNEAIFNKCISLLNQQNVLVIFPEGGHNLARRIRVLSKGFTRILFGAFDSHPNLKIQIIPVGLNYNSILNYPASCTIHYGKPIDASEYWNKDDIHSSTIALKKVVRNQMKELTTHIEDIDLYDETLEKLIANNANFLDPRVTNKLIKSLKNESPILQIKAKQNSKSFLHYLVIFNSIIPWLLWKKLNKKITEKEFTSTFRYALIITVFPLFYIIQTFIVNYFYTAKIALLYLLGSIIVGLLNTKFSKDGSD